MPESEERGMWHVVLFDLPVKTREQRGRATRFRLLLLDLGWAMEQYSVYVRYIPTGMSAAPEILEIRRNLPPQGKVEIVGITDRQWSKALRFSNQELDETPVPPMQLTIF